MDEAGVQIFTLNLGWFSPLCEKLHCDLGHCVFLGAFAEAIALRT